MDYELSTTTRTVYIWKCKLCDKEIVGLYPNQVKSLSKEHMRKHNKVE